MGLEDHDPNGDHVPLEAFVGLRTLYGIGQAMVDVDWIGVTETVQQVVLNVDGILYEFTEGANDGYRSSLGSVRSVRMTALAMAPIHPPLVVHFHHRTKGDENGYEFGPVDCLYAINERTGLVILDIGTNEISAYYPSFVFAWNPEGWTPEWLKPEVERITVKDHEGKSWTVLDDFASHAEANALFHRRRAAGAYRQNVCVRLNKKTMRFEVHERERPDE